MKIWIVTEPNDTYSSTSVLPVLDKLVQAMSNECQLLQSVKIHYKSIFLIILWSDIPTHLT